MPLRASRWLAEYSSPPLVSEMCRVVRRGPLMAKVMSIPRKQTTRRTRPKHVHQFLIVLAGIDPLVWRRIQVPATYSFWDLHVAIQDAMGWLDYHLHEFRLPDADQQR